MNVLLFALSVARALQDSMTEDVTKHSTVGKWKFADKNHALNQVRIGDVGEDLRELRV